MGEVIITIAVIRQDIVVVAVQVYIKLLLVHAQRAHLHIYMYVTRRLIAQQQVDIGAIIIASLCLVHHNKTQQIRQTCAQILSATVHPLQCVMEVM